MNIISAETALQSYLATNWTRTDIAWPNVLPADFAAPGQPLLPEGDTDYIAVRHEFTNSRFITVPGTCRRYSGVLYLSVFVRRETGTRTLADYTSDLINLFEGKQIAHAGEYLTVWTMTGSIDRELADWYTREIAFSMTFERHA